MVVVAVVAYLEEFLTCVVGLASFHRPAVAREYLKTNGNEHEKSASETYAPAELMDAMQGRVSIAKRGKRLERLCAVLLGSPPCPDDDTRRYYCDLVKVRNIIVHAGGWPQEAHARDVESPGLDPL
jgi:hypothetical protein